MLLSPVCAELESLHLNSFFNRASETTVAQWVEKTGAAKLKSLSYKAEHDQLPAYADNLLQELSKPGVASKLRHLHLVGVKTSPQEWNAFIEAIATGKFCLETLSLGLFPEKRLVTLMEAFKNNPEASATLIEMSFTISIWWEPSNELETVLLTLQEGLFSNLRKFHWASSSNSK
jgi:hypothetical protein